jgi:hypothetical protein
VKYESPITYHSKDMTNVKVFADKQTDKQTDGQAKNYMPPIFRYGGITKLGRVISKFYSYQLCSQKSRILHESFLF